MTTCLARPSTTFFDSQMKKKLSNTATKKLYPSKECEKNIKNNVYKINISLIIFTLMVIYNAKFVLVSTKLDNL